MKRYITLMDTDRREFEADLMKDIYVIGNELYIRLLYKVEDKNDKEKFKLYLYERFIGEYESNHHAVEKLRAFQELLE